MKRLIEILSDKDTVLATLAISTGFINLATAVLMMIYILK